jgi:hypothetical protein
MFDTFCSTMYYFNIILNTNSMRDSIENINRRREESREAYQKQTSGEANEQNLSTEEHNALYSACIEIVQENPGAMVFDVIEKFRLKKSERSEKFLKYLREKYSPTDLVSEIYPTVKNFIN